MTDYDNLRRQMVDRQIAGRGIRDPEVLVAMRSVPRELFVPEHLRSLAYDDGPLPIGEGQTISQPYIVALMTEALELKGGERVLEIGAGSGYAAAVLAQIAAKVITIERHRGLCEKAAKALSNSGIDNVSVQCADGTKGWPAEAPYDAIVVTAGGPAAPQTLKEQLAIGGRLVIPVGRHETIQSLVRIRRTGEDAFSEEKLSDVRFVPLIGEFGWNEGLNEP